MSLLWFQFFNIPSIFSSSFSLSIYMTKDSRATVGGCVYKCDKICIGHFDVCFMLCSLYRPLLVYAVLSYCNYICLLVLVIGNEQIKSCASRQNVHSFENSMHIKLLIRLYIDTIILLLLSY